MSSLTNEPFQIVRTSHHQNLQKDHSIKKLSKDTCLSLFRELLRFRTVSAGNFGSDSGANVACAKFLCEIAVHQCGCGHARLLHISDEKGNVHEGKPIVLVDVFGDGKVFDESDGQVSEDVGSSNVTSTKAPPSILLNGHYDVVPAKGQPWTEEPWKAERKYCKEENGDVIYGRGTQDMKCVLVMYLFALNRILASLPARERKPRIPIYLSFVPDEEIGGALGMGLFLRTTLFQKLNFRFALDEGLASGKNNNQYTIFHGERVPLWVKFASYGPAGHGSRFIKETAMNKLTELCIRALTFRRQEEAKLRMEGKFGGCTHCIAMKLGDVVTINLTMLQGGVSTGEGKEFALNVIPTKAEAGFDVRVPPNTKIEDVVTMLDRWCEAIVDGESALSSNYQFCGICANEGENRYGSQSFDMLEKRKGGVPGVLEWSFVPGTAPSRPFHAVTELKPEAKSAPFWSVFKNFKFQVDNKETTTGSSTDSTSVVSTSAESSSGTTASSSSDSGLFNCEIFPAATDSRFLRQANVPALGFSPLRDCPILLHEPDEYLSVKTFMEGIAFYEQILPQLSNVKLDS
eukprot:g1666.t1